MNRRHRRATAKQDRVLDAAGTANYSPDAGVAPVAPIVGVPASTGLLLRITARVLLSSWVLKRVEHPNVLAILRELAGQVGRMDAMMQIQEKLRRQSL